MAADPRAGRTGRLSAEAAGQAARGLPGDPRALPLGCEPACPGCRHRRLGGEESAAQKQRWLARQLAPWVEVLEPLRRAPQRFDYRDRVVLAAQWTAGGWRLGLRRGDAVVAIPRCPVHSPRVRAMAQALLRLLPAEPVLPLVYYVQSGRQAILVVKAADAEADDWLPGLMAPMRECGMEGLWLHLNPAAGRRVLAKNRWRLLWGRSRSLDEQGLCYGPGAFQQLQPVLHRQALDAAQDFLRPDDSSRVVDLYCGVGASLRRWTACGATALGVEAAREAVACARINVPAAQLLVGHCATRLPQLRAFAGAHGNALVYVNPPRTGLEPDTCAWLVRECRPQRLAYLSCSAATLARDLTALEAEGFCVERLLPFDFFPQTDHVETLALASLRQ